MNAPRNPARRMFLLAASAIAATLVRPRPAAAQRGGDNGIGGTGYAPPTDERDNGLGGTGVVGTIRRFGSIYVNDARIAYPRNARVTIDGRPARANELRIGHVVTLIASGPENALATRAIAVTHEVIGPVESVSGGRAKILGQDVILPKGAKTKPGQTVAVSGLRMSDRTIVASLIEKAPAGRALVTGLVERDARGQLIVGGLAVDGVDAESVGQRMRLTGALQDGVFATRDVDVIAVAPAGAKKLLLEAYARSNGADVTTPDGFSAVIAKGAEMLNGAARVVLSADRDDDGGWTVRAARMISNVSPGVPPSTLPGAPGGPGAATGQNLPGWPGGPGGPRGPGGAAGPGAPGAGMGSGAPTYPGAPNSQNLPGWPGGPSWPGAGPGASGPGGMGPGGVGPGGPTGLPGRR